MKKTKKQIVLERLKELTNEFRDEIIINKYNPTNIFCEACGNDPGVSKNNPTLWDGFYDQDLKWNVCNACKKMGYYKNKFQIEGMKGLYSEVPVTI
jgi:hypothetical protein